MDTLGYFVFQMIASYVDSQIQTFTEGAYTRLVATVTGLASIMFTIHILLSGLKIITGESRDTLLMTVTRWIKMSFILVIVGGFTIGASTTITSAVLDVRADIVNTMVGGTGNITIYQNIGKSLENMNSNAAAMEAGSFSEASTTNATKDRIVGLMIVGQGTPALIGGTLVLLNEIAFRIGILLTPLFVMCLMFQKTQDMFYTWAKLIVASVFSLCVLSIVVTICMNLSSFFSLIIRGVHTTPLSLFGIAVPALTIDGIGDNDNFPELTLAITQAGFGIVLSALLVAVPPMIGRYFGGAIDSHVYNQFTGMSPGIPQGLQQATQGQNTSNASANSTGSSTNQTPTSHYTPPPPANSSTSAPLVNASQSPPPLNPASYAPTGTGSSAPAQNSGAAGTMSGNLTGGTSVQASSSVPGPAGSGARGFANGFGSLSAA
jgi:type IV secretion system protein VirB6